MHDIRMMNIKTHLLLKQVLLLIIHRQIETSLVDIIRLDVCVKELNCFML